MLREAIPRFYFIIFYRQWCKRVGRSTSEVKATLAQLDINF